MSHFPTKDTSLAAALDFDQQSKLRTSACDNYNVPKMPCHKPQELRKIWAAMAKKRSASCLNFSILNVAHDAKIIRTHAIHLGIDKGSSLNQPSTKAMNPKQHVNALECIAPWQIDRQGAIAAPR
jgi:hypothetical protein